MYLSVLHASRIIPACAGETCIVSHLLSAASDHPRLRGGNTDRNAPMPSTHGSSPLARGKLGRLLNGRRLLRIIPACAGETATAAPQALQQSDHPRLRGGNRACVSATRVTCGSSPLARGKPSSQQPPHHHGGIIPACAGETARRGPREPCHPDHPRLCGGNFRTPDLRGRTIGSSPLARGKPLALERQGALVGIIPACAGETTSTGGCAPCRPDHPRLRGGNPSSTRRTLSLGGSSPLARGKHGT